MANEVRITITGDDKASGVFDKVKSSAGGLGSALSGVSKIAGGFVLGSAITSAPGFLFDAAQAAADDAAAMDRLKRAVENTGVGYDAYSKKIDDAIALGQKRGFTDDQTRNSLSLLTAQTDSAEEALKRLALAEDLSRGSGLDLETASKLLGKATDENVNVLKKMGISLKQGATEADLFAAVQKKFGGQADTFAKSTAGQMASAKIAMSELKEQLGYALLPVLAQLAGVLNAKVIPFMEKMVAKVGPAIDSFSKWAKNSKEVQYVVSVLGDGLKTLGTVIEKVSRFVSEHKAAMIALGVALGVLVAILFPIPAAFLAIVFVVGLLTKHWDDLKSATTSTFNSVKTTVTDAINQVTDRFEILGVVVKFHIDTIKNYITTGFNIIRDIFKIVTALIQGDWDAVWKNLQSLFNNIWNGIITDVGIKLEFLKGVFRVAFDIILFTAASIWNGVKDAVVNGVQGMLNAIANIPGQVQGYASSFGWAGLALGSALVNGIVGGFKSIGDFSLGLAIDFANKVKFLINLLVDKLNSLIPDKISIRGLPDADLPDNPIPHLAIGTRNFRGGLALVGENGPELVKLPRGANVYSNGETRNMARMLSGQGGGSGITVIVQGSIVSEKDITRIVRDAVQRGAFRGVLQVA